MKDESKSTWKDVVREALAGIGNSGHFDDIYSKIKGHPKTETNPTWRDTVSDFPRFLSYPKVVKVASYFDVIWSTGDTDALVPEFAFEVEH